MRESWYLKLAFEIKVHSFGFSHDGVMEVNGPGDQSGFYATERIIKK
jgi:hypothetical protein